MARDKDPPFRRAGTDDPDGWLEGALADEDGSDRGVFWRMSVWGVAAVAAVALGYVANRSSLDPWTTEASAKYFESKTAQAESMSREAQFESRRLAAAIETLNSDRDRIYARLSSVEQGFESVTGSIKAQESAIAKLPLKPAEAAPPPALQAAPPSQAPAPSPLVPDVHSLFRPPEAGDRLLDRTGSIVLPDTDRASVHPKSTETPVLAAEFGIDLGAAASMDGLRTIWRSTSAIHKAALAGLTPIVTIEERARQPLRFRLIAGPLRNAADAARLCVLLMEKAKDCKTSAFDGQRLQISSEITEPLPVRRPAKGAPKQGPRSANSGTRNATAQIPSQVSVLPSSPGR